MARFLFFVPENTAPTGGINVILDIHDLLREAGVASDLLCSRADFRYSFVTPEPQMLYEPRIRRTEPPVGRRARLRRLLPGRAVNRRLDLRPDDIVVVPDYAAHWMPKAFPDNRCVLLVQGFGPMAQSAVSEGWEAARFAACVATSEACVEMAELLSMANVRQIPVAVDGERFAFRAQKRDVVAYMPRRRADEARMVTGLLRRRGALAGYEFRAIDGQGQDGVAAALGDARFFLSFSQSEGFGLPPAEAMASGCIVIGFTGVGGNEYFDADVGIPVPDGDLSAFVRAVEAAVREYAEQPARLDAMRARAAARMRDRYGRGRQREAVVRVFRELAQMLEAGGRD